MNPYRDQIGAWTVVALLAAVLVAGWQGADRPPFANLACGHEIVVAELPGGGWGPDAELAGLPAAEPGLTSYDAAEARNLARLQAAPLAAVVAYGSSTSLKPTRMC